MKVKLSKSQWERIGKKAGWMKIAAGGGISMNAQDLEEFVNAYKSTPSSVYNVIGLQNISQNASNILNTLLENQQQGSPLVTYLQPLVDAGKNVKDLYAQGAFGVKATPEQKQALKQLVDSMAKNASWIVSVARSDRNLQNM